MQFLPHYNIGIENVTVHSTLPLGRDLILGIGPKPFYFQIVLK